MKQELRGPSCLMPCIRKDHHPCHVPLLPRWPRCTAAGMAPNGKRNGAKLAASQIRWRRSCSDKFLNPPFQSEGRGPDLCPRSTASSSSNVSQSDLFVAVPAGTWAELRAAVNNLILTDIIFLERRPRSLSEPSSVPLSLSGRAARLLRRSHHPGASRLRLKSLASGPAPSLLFRVFLFSHTRSLLSVSTEDQLSAFLNNATPRTPNKAADTPGLRSSVGKHQRQGRLSFSHSQCRECRRRTPAVVGNQMFLRCEMCPYVLYFISERGQTT